jgi:hypothetical protein
MLSGCSMVNRVTDNAATTMIGTGSAASGAVAGFAAAGPVGGLVGAMVGGGSGALLADKTIDQAPPTAGELLIQFLDTVGWWALIAFVVLYLMGVVTPTPRIGRKNDKNGK